MLYALIDSQANIKNNNLKLIIMTITLSGIGIIGIIKLLSDIISTPNNDTLPTNIPMSDTDKLNPLNMPNTQTNIVPTKETISDIAGKLNVNDNTAIQSGLNQMGNIASSLNTLK